MTLSLADRIERLESEAAIGRLAQAYALAIDARDLDALVHLYVDDVRVSDGQGRGALRAVFDASLRQFTYSFHHVTTHLIEFLGPEDAIGLVGCRIEHEVAAEWVTASLLYHDRYIHRDGTWLFRGRVQTRLYATRQGDPPLGPRKVRWPGAEPADGGFHDALPSWAEFWEGRASPPVDRAGAEAMVSRLRRGLGLPNPPPYIFTDRS